MAGYAHDVIRPELRQEHRHDSSCKQVLRRVRNLLICNASLVNECARVRLDQILARFNDQKILYQYRQQAEEGYYHSAGISRRLRGYNLQPG